MDRNRRPIGYWLKQLDRLPPSTPQAYAQMVKAVALRQPERPMPPCAAGTPGQSTQTGVAVDPDPSS